MRGVAREDAFRIFETAPNGYRQLDVSAGRRVLERVAPVGDTYAYTVQRWSRKVTVSVSPTGRSVRVWVDGEEVPRRATTEPATRATPKRTSGGAAPQSPVAQEGQT